MFSVCPYLLSFRNLGVAMCVVAEERGCSGGGRMVIDEVK